MRSLAALVGPSHVLTGDAAAGFAVDWTGRFRGHTPAVVRPRDTAEVAAVLALCTEAGLAVVPQGGNTGLVGGGVPRHGEVVLSLTRLSQMTPVDRDTAQVTTGAGVTLQQVADADADLDLGIVIASRATATVGGAVATNAGGLRVLRYGPMRAQLRGIEAVLSDGTVLSHLAGLVKDNTGYDYPSVLAGSEGTLAVITAARLKLVPRTRDAVTAIAGFGSLGDLHGFTRRAIRDVPSLLSAEFFTQAGLSVLIEHTGLTPPLPAPAPAYLLLEAGGPDALDALGAIFAGDPGRPVAVAESAAGRARLWACRERQPEAPDSSASPSSSTSPSRPGNGCAWPPRLARSSPTSIRGPRSLPSATSRTAMCTSTSSPRHRRTAGTKTPCSPWSRRSAARSRPSMASAR